MAFAATKQIIRGVPQYSVGPMKVEHFTFTAISGDTAGTITSQSLNTVDFCEVIGLTQTALPTYSGNVATIAFANPLATVFGQIKLYGR